MINWLIAALAGAVTGVLSGFGVGGGSLLLIYMTSFAGVAQNQAQGINLLYFLPAAAAALPAHFKNGNVEKIFNKKNQIKKFFSENKNHK